jgi:hypothetical protein
LKIFKNRIFLNKISGTGIAIIINVLKTYKKEADMDNKLNNEKSEVKEEKLQNFLEDFSVWKECRKLINILPQTYKDEEEPSRYFRNTVYGRAETIFINSAEIFECIRNGKNDEAKFMIESAFKELAALKTLIYISLDKGKIYVDDFSEIILQVSKIRKELENLRNRILHKTTDDEEDNESKKIFN